jgi:transcriptional regulator with XRE-family HTH domain
MMAPAEDTARPRGGVGRPNPVDVHVGSRVRLRRTLLGMSQEKLADALGLTFQQVQKYEKGTNRIAPSRLIPLAKLLKVEPAAILGSSNGGTEPIDIRLTTTGRNRILAALTKIDNRRIENAVADLLEEMTRQV